MGRRGGRWLFRGDESFLFWGGFEALYPIVTFLLGKGRDGMAFEFIWSLGEVRLY